MEVGDTIQSLVGAGINAKLLSADTLERSAATVSQLGLPDGELSMVSGDELLGLSTSDFSKIVRETTIFGKLTPAQKANVVRTLQQENGSVLVVGSSVGDVPAMRQADLRVALRSSSQDSHNILGQQESLFVQTHRGFGHSREIRGAGRVAFED